MLTNFHQPRSSLLVLLAAFIGQAAWRRAYAHALRSGYRFLSFGDCMLCWRVTQDHRPGLPWLGIGAGSAAVLAAAAALLLLRRRRRAEELEQEISELLRLPKRELVV